MSKDIWRHRTASMNCKTCMWYVEKVASDTAKEGVVSTVPTVGRCRRHSPCMNGYPVVFESDWCGDHKLNENA